MCVLKVLIFVASTQEKIQLTYPSIDKNGVAIKCIATVMLGLFDTPYLPVFGLSQRKTVRGGHRMDFLRIAPIRQIIIRRKTFQRNTEIRGADIVMPTRILDLNPLRFHFWSAAHKEVYFRKLGSNKSLLDCVKQYAVGYD